MGRGELEDKRVGRGRGPSMIFSSAIHIIGMLLVNDSKRVCVCVMSQIQVCCCLFVCYYLGILVLQITNIMVHSHLMLSQC
jgi:hypothetical protein